MQNLKAIAEKLAKLDGSRKQIAELLIDEGYYEGGDSDALAKILELKIRMSTSTKARSSSVSMQALTTDICVAPHIELFGDMFEITGWVVIWTALYGKISA